jgi:hypothetical protein
MREEVINNNDITKSYTQLVEDRAVSNCVRTEPVVRENNRVPRQNKIGKNSMTIISMQVNF